MAFDHNVRIVFPEDSTFDASKNLDEIHTRVQDFKGPRDLQSLDLFAGSGNFEAQCEKNGLTSAGYDILRDPTNNNLLTKEGFFQSLLLVLSLVPGRSTWQLFNPRGGVLIG